MDTPSSTAGTAGMDGSPIRHAVLYARWGYAGQETSPVASCLYMRVGSMRQLGVYRGWAECDAQLARAAARADAEGWAVVGTFRDVGAGATCNPADRPGLRQAMGLMRAEQADILIVTWRDRIARNARARTACTDELRALGASLVVAGREVARRHRRPASSICADGGPESGL